MIETGRVVMKIAGREAGKYAVIVDSGNDGFVMITGPRSVTGVKRRKCNVDHIEPTEHKLDIGQGDDASVEDSWKSSGLIEKLEIEVPRKRTKVKEDKPVEKAKKKK